MASDQPSAGAPQGLPACSVHTNILTHGLHLFQELCGLL